MEIRKKALPVSSKGEALNSFGERELIFFKVRFNNYRDVETDTLHRVRDKEEFDECECVLCLPESYTETGEPTQLIISCHGAGGRVCEKENMIGGVSLVGNCIDNGYAALDICGSAPNGLTMGCSEHIFALYKAYKYVVRHFNVTDKVLLSGGSMGGHVAINFANMFPSIVLAVGIFYPRLNIDGVSVDGHYCIGTWDKTAKGRDGISTHDRIVSVYRFPSDEWCEENTVGFNPYKIRSFIDRSGKRVVIPPCPIKIWQGDADTTVDPKMVTEFVESVKRSGSYIEYHLLEGIGHKTTPVMTQELLMWFNRFI